jgi:hypothetical protein
MAIGSPGIGLRRGGGLVVLGSLPEQLGAHPPGEGLGGRVLETHGHWQAQPGGRVDPRVQLQHGEGV